MKEALFVTFLASIVVCFLCCHVMNPHAGVAPAQRQDDLEHYFRGPYLSLGTPTSVWVVWRNRGTTDPSVRFGSAPTALEQSVSEGDIIEKRHGLENKDLALHSAPDGVAQYEANISGLDPASTYYYAIYDGDRRIAGGDDLHYFRTSPEPGTTAPFRFWVVGDSGTGTEMQATVHREMEKYTSRQKRPPDLFIHVGDVAYFNGTDDEFHFNFFGPYGRTLRNTVFWPAMGNHEGGTSSGPAATGPYFDNFVLPANGEAGGHPSGTEAYYSYDFGNAHFVVLNSYDEDRSPGGAMAAWLTADLQQTRADWIFAYWHHAPYTKGSHDSDAEPELIEMRENFMPILEEGGVDMVFSGHSHIYERSMLIDKAYATPTIAEGVVVDDGDGDPDGDGPYRKNNGSHPHEGTVVVVTGHGGITLNRLGTMPIMKRIIYPEHGSVLIDVEGHVASGIMLNSKGKLSDTFQVVKDRRRE